MPPALPTPPLLGHPADVPHIDDVLQPSPDRPSRSASATSSLDPYYFGIGNESPLPPLPSIPTAFSTTPDSERPVREPVTPVRDPADIDRRGLVGVGELATPRWTRFERKEHNLAIDPALQPIEGEEEQEVIPDSPWTIEAVDGEGSEKEQLLQLPRPLRSRPSLNEESGGEEIVYPRSHPNDQPTSPPSSFTEGPRRARKRTSDEFEKDFDGVLVAKRDSLPTSEEAKEKVKEPRVSARRHKSLGSNAIPPIFLREKTKERRRESVGHRSSKHTKQPSTGSSSNPAEPAHSRRVHTTDFSHLPPSPSTSSIQQILRQPPTAISQSQSSSNVAHSLLRGTQEGWSGMDDEATAEALRKLDGLSGKASRSRMSLNSTSRPPTPPRPSENSRRESIHRHGKDSDQETKSSSVETTRKASILSDEDPSSSSAMEKTPKRASARSSLQPKRISGSSTNYTGTPSSRDSTSMSATTSVTSVSAASARAPSSKSKRNSGGSDNSSVHSNEGTTASSAQETIQDEAVPPVPPLPKDLSSYRSPPASSAAAVFPTMSGEGREPEVRRSMDAAASLRSYSTDRLASTQPQHSEPTPISPKTPSKKWSFSGALNIKLSHSSSSSTPKAHSPKSNATSRQLRKSISKEYAASPSLASTKPPWSPTQPDAMASAASLASITSSAASKSPHLLLAKTPDNGAMSHPETDSSSGGVKLGAQGPLSPSSSVRRGQSTKRLTPSSIPFFRRSSSQSMQIPPGTSSSFSPPSTEMQSIHSAVDSDYNPPSTSSKATPSKKASVLSLGLPSLLKSSSSRRSLHSDKESKEQLKPKESEKHKSHEKEKSKKDDKDRSESRISVLMGRKRGKTVSSTEPGKSKPVVSLPPMQISALPPSTAQKVASLKTSPSTSVPSTPSRSSSSRLTHQTISSLQKQSDSSLRSRTQLPTIAGSPSVGPVAAQSLKEASMNNAVKETPTKIPRISSRSGSGNSPTPRHTASGSTANNRLSMNVNGLVVPSQTSSPVQGLLANEFGVMEQPEEQSKTITANAKLPSVRASPSASTSTSRVPRQVSGPTPSRKTSNRESISFSGLRKASTSSVSASITAPEQPSVHRFSALSPSKGLKLLSPKISLTSPRASSSSTARASQHSPSSSHPSLSTPSPTIPVDDDEVIGDREMMGYIRRQQAKKLASGATQEELDDLLRFPEPLPPGKPMSPSELLRSPQGQYLSEYEKVEMQDYPEIYCIGARSKKKQARPDDSTNNYGYDDDRGDYLVVNRDHLAYRYEVMDTLGKGSFGQVLHCRDHRTGESTAIKIIRNKKRFHHQALVEIKILDNLRKWDPDEKHHVLKMTDHFYFRNHLCIATELLSINLYELIKANGFAGFSTSLIRRFTSQMLLSLSLTRHHRVVHCDLKPENVLLRHPAKSGIKVIDFGSSCFEHEKIYTYIQSRFYRSPEVILGMNYHMAIDMWSLGCILAELYTGFPIFPGENEQEQLACIMEVLGVPDKDFINRSSRKRLFFEPNGAPRAVVNSKGRRRKPGSKSLAQVLRCNDEEFIDFVAKCLIWDPERRIKPQAALRHPFILGPKGRSNSALAKSSLSTSSLTTGSRNKLMMETPKKSQISAPAPLTARSSRTIAPTTPGSSATKSYRTQPVSYSSRTLNGLSSGVSK